MRSIALILALVAICFSTVPVDACPPRAQVAVAAVQPKAVVSTSSATSITIPASTRPARVGVLDRMDARRDARQLGRQVRQASYRAALATPVVVNSVQPAVVTQAVPVQVQSQPATVLAVPGATGGGSAAASASPGGASASSSGGAPAAPAIVTPQGF